MKYADPEEARDLPGLRLALTEGGPGPWSESAKAIFHVKNLAYTPVRQAAGGANEALAAWTGHRNAPIAVYESEPARAGWCEILLLAERLAPEPSLLPADCAARALAIGLAHEIAGEQGLGWSRRLVMLHDTFEARRNAGKAAGRMGFMAGLYGYSPDAARRAHARVVALLEMLSDRIEASHARGAHYLLGDELSAPDLYWACFAAMFAPLPDALCPMPAPLRTQYSVVDPQITRALRAPLLDHRDRIYAEHLKLPLDF